MEDAGGCFGRAIRGGVMVLVVALSGCGLIPEPVAGLACQDPPTEAEALTPDQVERQQVPPLLGTPVEEAAARIAEVGILPSWRYQYLTNPPDRTQLYSECWCVPPPDGEVINVLAQPGEQLVVFVHGNPIAGGRPQPRMGWGCGEE